MDPIPISTSQVRGRFSKKRKLSGHITVVETGCGNIRLDDELDSEFWLSIYLPKSVIEQIRNLPAPVEEDDGEKEKG